MISAFGPSATKDRTRALEAFGQVIVLKVNGQRV